MRASGQALRQLQTRIGYTFCDAHLLSQALSHRSVEGAHNERLEFLGDAILSFVIAEQLYVRFPRAEEGLMSRLRASLVRRETLSEIAQELQLGACLRLGPGELKSGGHRRASILEDALEALIGAVYLDGGIDACRTMVLSWFELRLEGLSLKDNPRDSKSRLQEWLQRRALSLPSYQVLRTEGAEHDQTFFVEASIVDLKLIQEGSGPSRKQAEQNAAKAMLDYIESNKDLLKCQK